MFLSRGRQRWFVVKEGILKYLYHMDLISIIIPVYNRTDRFRHTLSSALGQTYKRTEIIVVDDGSLKNTVPFVIKDLLKFHNYDASIEEDSDALLRIENIQYYRQENKGAPAARNRGLELVKGEYVIFWDADIVAKPEMLQKMYDALQKNPEANFTYSNYGLWLMAYGLKQMRAQQFNFNILKKNNYIHTTSLIRRKDIIKWDESLKRFQDWDYWLTMVEQGKKGVWIDEYLFNITGSGTISGWLPKCAYKKPWRYFPWIKSRVKKYEEAKKIVMKKHGLL